LVPMTAGRAILKIIPTAEHELASKSHTPEQIASGASPAGFYGLVGAASPPRTPSGTRRKMSCCFSGAPRKRTSITMRTSPCRYLSRASTFCAASQRLASSAKC
jgi:hypothetical protein